MKETIVLSTERSRYFAQLIAARLKAEVIGTERRVFENGELYFRAEIRERGYFAGKDVVFVGATVVESDWSEMIRIGATAARGGARRVIYVIPYFGYSTMERAVRPGEAVTAKEKAKLLSDLPKGDVRNAFLMLDLHTSGLVHYFERDALTFELYGEEALVTAIKELILDDLIFASADMGRPRWVEKFAERFGTDLALIRKVRNFEDTRVKAVIGEVRGKNVVIYDDMARSGGSLVKAAEEYLRHGALSVSAVVSHLALTPGAAAKLIASPLHRIIATNSHPMCRDTAVRNSEKFVITDVSDIFAEQIGKLL